MLYYRTKLLLLLTNIYRTMAWAIDLDDTNGTAINNLGNGMNKKKEEVYTGDLHNNTDLGTFNSG